MLQWGRNLTVAEGAKVGRRQLAEIKLQWGRNLTVAEGDAYAHAYARMHALQWGRNLTVAEGWMAFSSMATISALQWGRNLTVAEGGGPPLNRLPAGRASMGPQLDSCGRPPAPRARCHGASCFNGAAT